MKKRLLLFARDPGGANVIMALIPELSKKYQILVYGKDVALEFFKKEDIEAKDMETSIGEITIENLEEFLKQNQIDVVITGTSADDNTEKYLWKAAEHLSIVSMAILDQWANYGVRFSKYSVSELDSYKKEMSHDYIPTRICVMDAYAKKKTIEEGIEEGRIWVTGQPYLAKFAQEVHQVSVEEQGEYRSRFVEENEKLMIFASEPIGKIYGETCEPWGYTEATVFKEFRRILVELAEKEKCKVSVVIRPHPKEDMEQWKTRLENSSYVKFYIDRSATQKVVIRSADLIVGMSSMFLLESVLCQTPIISLQMGLKPQCDNPFILQKIGLAESAVTREQAYEALKNFVQGRQKTVRWDIPMNAVEKIERLIDLEELK